MADVPKIAVRVAAQVVAAGIFGDKARVTLTFAPMAANDTDTDVVDLAKWPSEIAKLLGIAFNPASAATAPPPASIDLQVFPLKGEGWRDGRYKTAADLDGAAARLPFKHYAKTNDLDALDKLWFAAMAGTAGLTQIQTLLSGHTGARDDLLRAPKTGGDAVPDIHGTGRADVAIKQTAERASAIALQAIKPYLPLRRAARPARPPHVFPQKSTPRASGWMDARAADLQAWENLGDSRERADGIAVARRRYEAAPDRTAAIGALKAASEAIKNDEMPTVEIATKAVEAFAASRVPTFDHKEAVSAYRLASKAATKTADSRQIHPQMREGASPEDATVDEMARRRFFALQSNPSLGRLFHLVIDAECDAAKLAEKLEGAQGLAELAIVDLLAEPGSPPAEIDKLPKPQKRIARFALLGVPLTFPGRRSPSPPPIWTLAKHRDRDVRDPKEKGKAGHFYPAAREEYDCLAAGEDPRALGACDSIDAIIDLRQSIKPSGKAAYQDGTDRYAILTLDAITSTGALDSKARETDEAEKAHKPETRRGAGMALADRRRRGHAIARFCASEAQAGRDSNGKPLILDATDLTAGYKLDVGVRSTADKGRVRSRWHTLMHRTVCYTLAVGRESPPALAAISPIFSGDKLEARIASLYPDLDARREADDGLFHAPAALREWKDEKGPWPEGKTTAFAEEIVGAWRGDPPGLACGLESHRLRNDDLPFGIVYDLPARPASPALVPPPARYGWGYHFAMRAVFLGGVSMPLEQALGHYELSRIVKDANEQEVGSLILPEARAAGHRFVRHERIEAPTISVPDNVLGRTMSAGTKTSVELRGAYPVAQAAVMVVRGVRDPENRKLARLGADPRQDRDVAGVGFDRRVLLLPSVSLDVAGLHGGFDRLGRDQLDGPLKLAEPRLMMEDDVDLAPDEQLQEPCPLAAESTTATKTPVWTTKKVAWRSLHVASRPKGGLKGFDHRAAWGGLPIYRAAAAEPDPEPKMGERVLPRRTVTDRGEILHRAEKPIVIFAGDPRRRRDILFPAVGAPSGAAVFRPLEHGRARDVERVPYYPDPGARGLVLAVWRKGAETGEPIALRFADLYPGAPDEATTPVPAGYPDALPLVLDLVPVADAPRHQDRIVVDGPRAYPDASGLTAVRARIRIGPGEELSIGAWARPTKAFLAYMFEAPQSILALSYLAEAMPISKVAGSMTQALATFAPRTDGKDARPITSLGGLRAGFTTDLAGVAARLASVVDESPVRMLAAVTTLDAVYAVDLPTVEPATDRAGLSLVRVRPTTIEGVLGRAPCRSSEPPNALPPADEDEAVPILLSGNIGRLKDARLEALGPTVGAIEITAVGSAAARGRFDDPERGRPRDDIARGLWPKPDGTNPMSVSDLYGFGLDADGYPIFRPEVARLLRLEGFPRDAPLDLLDLQRRARKADCGCAGPGDKILRAERPPAFPDARARYIKLYAQISSPHGGTLATRYGEAAVNIVVPPRLPGQSDDTEAAAVAAKPLLAQWLNATIRPSRPVGREPQPSFDWRYSPEPGGSETQEVLIASRRMMVRLRFARPWCSSGEGERAGLVVWPPHLPGLSPADLRADTLGDLAPERVPVDLAHLPADGTDEQYLQDADLGLGGAYVTRWGADPIRQEDGLKGWLMSRENLPDLPSAMPGETDPFAGPDTPKTPVFVPNVSMPLPTGDVTTDAPPRTMIISLLTYAPRFDPQEEEWHVDVRIDPCSAMTPFVRLGLVRYQPHARAHLRCSEPVTQWVQLLPDREFRVTGERFTSGSARMVRIHVAVSGLADSADSSSRMEFTLRRRRPVGEGDSSEEQVGYQSVDACCGGARAEWRSEFTLPAADYDKADQKWSVTAAETEVFRPGTYADEPRPATAGDKPLMSTGERFVARVPLARLRLTTANQKA